MNGMKLLLAAFLILAGTHSAAGQQLVTKHSTYGAPSYVHQQVFCEFNAALEIAEEGERDVVSAQSLFTAFTQVGLCGMSPKMFKSDILEVYDRVFVDERGTNFLVRISANLWTFAWLDYNTDMTHDRYGKNA